MQLVLGGLYMVLESLGFIQRVEGQRWCSPEVESFLQGAYKKVDELSWAEEDSLKYYFFFYVYAQDQRNLINFSGDGESFWSVFFGDESAPSDFWYSATRTYPRSLLSQMGLSEQRILGFLRAMEQQGIVQERFYSMSSFSFFGDDDTIYVIKDIKQYMTFLTRLFLTPVIDSLLKS